MKKMLFALTLLATQQGFAASTTWEGPGSLFDTSGKPTANYQLSVEISENGNQSSSLVTITLADGTQKKHQCTSSHNAAGSWESDCDYGKGGGHCFGEGLCLSYEEDVSGKAFATTIIMDGPNDMRLLRTELQNGRAVQFFREKLRKRP